MLYENDLLKMKILIYFHQNEPSLCTVGKIADRLGSFKQKVSKILIELELEELVDRSDNRHPVLTKKGILLADKYTNSMKMTMEYLINEGVSLENVEKDAYNIVMCSSDSTMDAIKRRYTINAMKKELRGMGNFCGKTISEYLYNGMYPINFIIYRQHAEYNNHISMANNGFEHPAHIFVENGVGKIRLKIKDLRADTPYKGMVKGKASEVHYLYEKKYEKAEMLGDFVTLPLNAMKFTSMGNDSNLQIEGSIFMKIKSTINTVYMPESEAIFTVVM